MRPRYGRICSALSSLGITLVAVLGATGVLPISDTGQPRSLVAGSAAAPAQAAMRLSGFSEPVAMRHLEPRMGRAVAPQEQAAAESDTLPDRSGSGKRVVFDMSAQRVWLVDRGDRVRRTYLVSGSVTDNLKPGAYEVYSTSRHAVGIDDSGQMQYMVRFTHGDRAAIGFHDIPVDDGGLVQTRDQLGTPQSHGCIRQWRPDAKALWDFAVVGTKVVVTA
jgi:lipoprotein-anchoring transpeptidase ErfK/SrfK